MGIGQAAKDIRKFYKMVSHEVPTGPHTDVRRRKINPSFLKNRRSGSDPKRAGQMATRGYGKAYMKGGRVGFSSGYSTFGKRSGPRKSGGTGRRNK